MSTTDTEVPPDDPIGMDEDEFKPTGTVFVLTLFLITTILLWASVYVILLSRGVTL